MKSVLAYLIAALLLISCATRPVGQDQARGPGWYTVKVSDTLYSIAWRYGLDSQQLANWNQIDLNEPIHPGQRLRLISQRLQSAQVPRSQSRTASPQGVASVRANQLPAVPASRRQSRIRKNGSGLPSANQ